ncbi:hypothetical protein ACIQYS_14485 [Psychrobacillus sp. NPDC096426]|uniref:hypothetical protein n=1 Tax=Psychrobacillus sp. NPDC096426 TaxID=3364491 RepID=UPI003805916D
MAGNRVISAVLTLRDQNFGSTAGRAANSTRDLERRVKSTGNAVGRFGKAATSGFASAAKGAAGMVAAYMGINAVKNFGVSMIESAASAQAMSSQFEQVFSGMESAANSSLSKVADETGILSGRLKGSFLGMAAFAKTTGMDTASSLGLAERATKAAADGAAFYDKSIEDVSESLQSFLKGNFANDAALGISATETTRNATANKLYGKSFKKLSEDQKQLTLLQMVEDGNKLSGALGQAARETDGLENVMGNLRESWKLVKEKLGEPILEPAINGMKRLTDWIGNINTDAVVERFKNFGSVAKNAIEASKPALGWMKDVALPTVKDKLVEMYTAAKPGLDWMKDTAFPAVKDAIGFALDKAVETYNFIKDNWSLISPVIAGVVASIAAYKLGVMAITTATALWEGVTSAASIATGILNGTLALTPLGWIVLGIGAVVAAGVLLYKNWDKVTEVCKSMGDSLKGVWTDIQIGFSNAWSDIKTAAGKSVNFMIDKINDFIGVVNKIAGVAGIEIPMVAKVEWGESRKVAQRATGLQDIDSFAVGTNRVRRDMVANIHKDEMIVPAVQSRNLRKQGVTIDNIDRALPSGIKPAATSIEKSFVTNNETRNENNRSFINNTRNEDKRTVTNIETTKANNTKSESKTFNFGDIHIHGTNLTVAEVVNELVPQLKLRMANM